MTELDDYLTTRADREARSEAVITRLRAYRPMVARYQARRDEYEQTLPLITPVYSDMPKTAPMTLKADRVADERWWRREEMDKLRDELVNERAWIIREAGRLNPSDEAVLIRRYLIGQTMEVIAAMINCDQRTVRRWHMRGIRRMAENCPQMSANVRPD